VGGGQNEIQTPNPPHMDSDDDSDDDLEVIDSPLNQKLTCQGVTIYVAIYKGREGRWILEVVDYCDNTSYLWNDHFETDQHALDEAIRSFEEDPTAYSGALDHERYRTINPPSRHLSIVGRRRRDIENGRRLKFIFMAFWICLPSEVLVSPRPSLWH
jgi:hypothetical protein